MNWISKYVFLMSQEKMSTCEIRTENSVTQGHAQD